MTETKHVQPINEKKTVKEKINSIHVTITPKEFYEKLEKLQNMGVSPTKVVLEALKEYFANPVKRTYTVPVKIKVESKQVSL